MPAGEASLFIDEIVNSTLNKDGLSIEDRTQFYVGINSMNAAQGSDIQLGPIIDIIQSYGEYGIKKNIKVSLKSMIEEIVVYVINSYEQVTKTDLTLLTWGNPYVYNAVKNAL